MYQNTPEETQYQFKETDSTGAVLDGNNQYTVTFAKGETPPVKGFWSLTLYNAEHFFNPNPLGVYSRGTKDRPPSPNTAAGSVGPPSAPDAGHPARSAVRTEFRRRTRSAASAR